MVKIQQGDVLFKQIDPSEFKQLKKEESSKQYTNWKLTSGLKSPEVTNEQNTDNQLIPNDKCTVALGEATGHHHRFETATNNVRITAYKNSYHFNRNNPQVCDYVAIEGEKDGYATLTHEEHNPIQVPTGYYKIDIVKEFDHFSQLERRVVD
tara:strand:+ start:13575 stop:14030 length:456 start_codon:yes stop_codon:yes gene_type:complete